MNSTIGPAARIRAFVKWTITPPQAYGAYLVALVLVAGLSFYAGTLKPKRPAGFGPPPMTAPHQGE